MRPQPVHFFGWERVCATHRHHPRQHVGLRPVPRSRGGRLGGGNGERRQGVSGLQLAPRISADDDPLEWWKENQTRFPTLFPMAKSFLGCPATTAELERVFSKAGKLHDDQRKRTLDVTLEQQLFAAFNWKC